MRKKRTVILLILLIIMIIITIFTFNLVKNSKINETIIEPTKEGTVIPKNSYLFFGKYINGVVSSKEFYETISDYYKYDIPQIHKELKSNKNFEEYYNTNSEKTKMNTKVEFDELAKLLGKLNYENLELESLEIKSGTIIQRTDYTIAEIIVKYKNNEAISMLLKVYVNTPENGQNIEFSIVK